MKLTSEQIERLYEFTRRHYVEYYDLQTELTDHLAHGIEAQWHENPKVSFEEALQIEFRKFGVFGFMDVVAQRRTALTKKYNGLVWQHLKEFFKLPKIIGSLGAIVLLKLFFGTIAFSEALILTSFVVLLLILVTGLLYMRHKNLKKAKASGKKWLFEQIIFTYGSFVGYSYLPTQIFLRIWDHTENNYVLWFLSILIVLLLLLEYIILIEIPRKSEEYLTVTYPEYKLTQQV